MVTTGLILHRDYETRSTVDLRKTGAHVYAEHPTTTVIVAVFIVEDAGHLRPPIIWRPGDRVPREVIWAAEQGWTVAGHNAAFEQAIDRHVMGPRPGFPIIPDEQVDCTLARCAIMALPLDLARACAALNLKHQKDEAGHRLMLKMCKPRKVTKAELKAGVSPDVIRWHETPEEIARLTSYCVADVRAEIELGRAVAPMSEAERQVWLLDQKMNNRGVQIDARFATVARNVSVAVGDRLNARMKKATGGAVEKATQVDRIKDFCKLYGVPLRVDTKKRRNGEEYEAEAADKEAVQDLLDGELPATVREALEIRLEAGKASVKKLDKFLLCSCSDGRSRGNLQYHGAAPGRWAGRLIQLQNMIRAGITKDEGGWEQVFRDMLDADLDLLELLYGPTLDVISRMLRGSVIAAPGKKLIFGDYSNVEARGCAWSSKQQDMVELFASGGKIYETVGASIYGMSIDAVIAGHVSGENKMPRFIGKETVLGCGYGMGPDAMVRNVKKKSRIVLPYDDAYKGVYGWREANWRTVEYWRELEDAAKAAIENPGAVFHAGPVSYRVKGKWLQCRLPSGRILWYRRPTIEPQSKDLEQLDDGDSVPEYRWAIHYWTLHATTKQWCKVSTWGGKLLQNVIEGICRDFLAGAMLRLDARGYDMVLSVHDEAISEVPHDFGTVEEFLGIMTVLPGWGAGFPLKAEGGSGTRYAKA